jgi:succinoglycan biosynthesis transport protein ExoP
VTARDYLQLLHRRWLVITLVTLLCGGAALALSLSTTKEYASNVSLFVSASQSPTEAAGSLVATEQLTQQRVTSYAALADSTNVAAAVIRQLGLRESPKSLASRISATVPTNTVVIELAVTDPSRALVPRIATAVGEQLSKTVAQLEAPATGKPSPVRVSVSQSATLPGGPVVPKTTRNVLFGLVVGLALGAGLSILLEVLDTRIKDLDTLRDRLELAPLGLMHFDRKAKTRPLVVRDDPRSGRAEAFRQLRTNLHFLGVEHPPRSIVVTSSLPAEGKSTTTANLAIALAQAREPVTVIDADFRHPQLSQYLDVRGGVGLSEVLIGRATLDEALKPWEDGMLTVLASGATPPNPSELLGSRAMRRIVAELRERGMLIIDSPPVLPFTDAAVLAKVVDTTLLVVRANATRMDKLERAIQALRTVDAQLAGAVLNMVPTSGPEIDYYGYYSDEPGRQDKAKTPPGGTSTPGLEAERTRSSSLAASRD